MGKSFCGYYAAAGTYVPELSQEVDGPGRNSPARQFMLPSLFLTSWRKKFERAGTHHQVSRIRLNSGGLNWKRVKKNKNTFQGIPKLVFFVRQEVCLGKRSEGQRFLREEHVKYTSYAPYVGRGRMGEGLVPYVLGREILARSFK